MPIIRTALSRHLHCIPSSIWVRFNLAREEICHKARWDPSILAHRLTNKKSHQLPWCNLSDSFSDSCSWAVELCGHHHHHFYHYHYKDYCTKSLRVLAYLTVLYDLVEPFHWTDSGLFIKTLLCLLSCAWVENNGNLNIALWGRCNGKMVLGIFHF